VDRFDWLPRKKEDIAPESEHIATFWTLRGVTDRDYTCAAYRVQTGLELRVGYSDEDLTATQLFRGADAEERLAEAADTWRLRLLGKGSREIAEV
jgi:hypothetical protein